MKPMHILVLAGVILISPAASHAQVAGTTSLGVTVTELQAVTKGWSVKRTILGATRLQRQKRNASERSMTS